ncbi:Fumarylacetoacetase [Fusarium acuminatum]|uniref:Fumarylacetoacetase n=1 Tax=Fusarium acuminatum TaxID=5515 RepID=A0ABZ2WQS7_9HYPO
MGSTDFSHHFSEKNIPFGIASSEIHKSPQAVTRLENTVVFLHGLEKIFKDITDLPASVFNQPTLNAFAALPKTVHQYVRKAIQQNYQKNGIDGFPPTSREDIGSVTMHLPVEIKDFAVVNNPKPPPGFFHFPVGYQGRTSSIVVSGTDIERPYGQFRNPAVTAGQENAIVYGPSQKVDYEVELAAVIGKPLPMKQRLNAKDAEEHIFGFVILNDWSARDIQGFEMSPLGPFNGKSLGTSISPWIITLDALEPFKVRSPPQQTLSATYLQHPNPSTYSITMKVEVLANSSATTLGVCPVEALYWTPQQMVAHSVSSGSALRTGDIMATGTVSGSDEASRGCMLETTEGGTKPVTLSDGSKRGYLEDGDVVRITASVGEESGVGFGECIGKLTPARSQ